jgi:putative transposase
MLQALQHGRERELYDLWAYVIMPEHVHLVLYPRPHTLIRDVLKAIKQSVSRRALQWLENNNPEFLTRLAHVNAAGVKSHRFWQRGGGYDRNLRSIADVHEKIAYCHNNPNRRGLVDRASSWQWSSALAWETGRDEPIAIDRESVPRL